MTLSASAKLGTYEILAMIGKGGMGEVYRARDTKLKREVAIKALPEAFAQDADRLARFQREAELLASLNHPNIAAVYGFEQADGLSAIVLELVEGQTLAEVLAAVAPRGLSVHDALVIVRQIIDALEAAHDRGIIHRDLKPANIKITPEGKVKVLDFGLAKVLEVEPSASSLTMSPTLSVRGTFAGVILGTAAYMSPEQARGKPVDRRTDIWAFGCVLFEMLAGRQVFEAGETVSDAVAAVLRSDPDWNALPADLPPHLRKLLRRCLQKDVLKRLPHIAMVRIEIDEGPLEDAAAHSPTPAEALPSPPVWRRAIPFVLTALIVGLLTAAGAWRFHSVPAPSNVARFSFVLPEGQNFTNVVRQVLAISPDGSRMVYVANQRLYLRKLSELESRDISGTQIAEGNPAFSPDGQWIAFRSSKDGTLKRIGVNGGVPVTICPIGTNFGLHWYGDSILIGQGAAGISRVAADGGTPQTIVSVKSGEFASSPQMLPDGQTILFTLSNGSDFDTASIVAESPRGRKTILTAGSDARYLPTGHLVYAVSGNLFAVPIDLASLTTRGGAAPVIEGVRRAYGPGTTGAAQVAVSSVGTLAYVPGPASVSTSGFLLAVADENGKTNPLKLPAGQYAHPRVSPDGKRLAYAVDDGKEANVFVYDLSGATTPSRLTFSGKNRFPVWWGNDRIVFQSDRDGDLGMFWQRWDGKGEAERLTPKPEAGTQQVPDSWSPDGKTLLFDVAKDSDVSLWIFSVDDKKVTPVADVRSRNPMNATFSHDGHWVAYTVSNPFAVGRAGLANFVRPFPLTPEKHQLPQAGPNGNGIYVTWSPDDTRLFVWLRGTGVTSVSVTTKPSFALGTPVTASTRSWRLPGPTVARTYDVLPDGRFLGLLPSGDEERLSASATTEIRFILNWFEELKQRH